ALGSACLAMAPVWVVVLAAATIVGLGYGMLVVLLNLGFSRSFGHQGVSALNLLNAVFGVGAVAGPALLALALDRWTSLTVLSGAFIATAFFAGLLTLAVAVLDPRLGLSTVQVVRGAVGAGTRWVWAALFSALLLF